MKYKVLGRIIHSGGVSIPGDIAKFSSVEADPLLKAKVIEPYRKPFSAAVKAPPCKDESAED